MRLRILHVTPYSEAAWAYGGIPRVAGALTRGLARRGHSVTVCATDAHGESTRLPMVRPEQRALPNTSGGMTQRIFPNISNRLAYHQQMFLPVGLRDYLRQHAAEFDVAHLHACRNLPCALASHYLRRAGVPYVVQPNGTAPVIERHQLAKHVFDFVAGRRVMTGADRVLAVSMAERHQLADLGVPEASIRVIGNPIDLAEFSTPIPRGRFRRQWELGDDPIVLFLGKITPRKNVDTLVRSFAQLGDRRARLVIAGNDMGGGQRARTLAHELGVGARTLFTGLLTGAARLEALADADVVVYASQHEIFGLVPFEAILAGTPVVVADDSGCGDLVSATGAGVVVPVNRQEPLAQAIDDVLAHAATWRLKAQRANHHVRARYGDDVVCGQVEEVYEELHSRQSRVASHQSRVTSRESPVTSRGPYMKGVSVVIPLRNGAAFIRETLQSVWAQNYEPIEIIVVDDGSTDRGLEIVRAVSGDREITVLSGNGRGAAAAMNMGMRRARHSIVCQIDQDVVLGADWITALLHEFDADDVAAVQGIYVTDPRARLLSRVMSRDLEERYAAILNQCAGPVCGETDHVCTGNVAYRADSLRQIGFFDEGLGYGYDNDLSYRLRAAGYRLVISGGAQSLHRWRDDVAGYFRQQYGFGYGRLDVVAKHPNRVGGDAVSPTFMMLHPALLLLSLVTLAASVAGAGNARGLSILGVTLIAALILERAVAGIRAAARFRDLTPLWFPLVHLLRDFAWVCAIVVWVFRRLAGAGMKPSHSMQARTGVTADLKVSTTTDEKVRAFRPAVPPLIIIPAFNEARNLRPVVEELRAAIPRADILVVDDGSTDDTEEVVSELNVRWVRLPQRMGVGTAMRVGLRYSVRQGFGIVARLDGDGQHQPEDVKRLLEVIGTDKADIAFGSRDVRRRGTSDAKGGTLKRALAACVTVVTRRRVLDATCGLSAMGPRAIRLLAEVHPTGYPEPELRLLISRTPLTAVDVAIKGRPRLNGRTSLTPLRILGAAARVALAMCVVPLRRAETEPSRD